MYQGNTTNNGNRGQFVIQNHHFTYQRKGNHELAIQALSLIVAGLQKQIILIQGQAEVTLMNPKLVLYK